MQDLGREVDDMASEISKQPATTTSTTTTTTKGKNALPNPSEFDTLSPDMDDKLGGDAGDDDYYANFEQQRQVEMMAAQDQQLDGVFRTVGNLRQQADTMGRELEDQAVLLDDVEGLADTVGGKLASGMKRIRTIVRKNEGEFWTFIGKVIKLVQIAKLIMWYNRHVFDLLYRNTSRRPRPPVHPIACSVIIYKGNGRIAKQLLEINRSVQAASNLGLDLLGWAVFVVLLIFVVQFFNVHLVVKVIGNFV